MLWLFCKRQSHGNGLLPITSQNTKVASSGLSRQNSCLVSSPNHKRYAEPWLINSGTWLGNVILGLRIVVHRDPLPLHGRPLLIYPFSVEILRYTNFSSPCHSEMVLFKGVDRETIDPRPISQMGAEFLPIFGLLVGPDTDLLRNW